MVYQDIRFSSDFHKTYRKTSRRGASGSAIAAPVDTIIDRSRHLTIDGRRIGRPRRRLFQKQIADGIVFGQGLYWNEIYKIIFSKKLDILIIFLLF